MAVVGIYTELVDTDLGTFTPDDGICMLICPATAQSASGGLQYELNIPYLIYSLNDLVNLGVTAENNPLMTEHVTKFYAKAGNGAKLWVVGYEETFVALQTLVNTTLPIIIRQTVTTGFDYRPRIIGIVGSPKFVTATTASDPLIPADVETLVGNLNTQLDNLFVDSFRMCAVVDSIMLNCANSLGISYEQLASRLESAALLQAPSVAVQLTSDNTSYTASVGQTLGLLASITIATSPGSLQLPFLNKEQYYVDANAGEYIYTPVSIVSNDKVKDIGSKQYLFSRTFPQVPGTYFNDGATCNEPTKALSSLEFVRVGNAVCDAVEAFFVRYLNSNVPVTTSGDIDPGYKSATLSALSDKYLTRFETNQYVSKIVVDFVAKDGNFVESRAIEVSVKILPMASLREVYEKVMFVSSL